MSLHVKHRHFSWFADEIGWLQSFALLYCGVSLAREKTTEMFSLDLLLLLKSVIFKELFYCPTSTGAIDTNYKIRRKSIF